MKRLLLSTLLLAFLTPLLALGQVVINATKLEGYTWEAPTVIGGNTPNTIYSTDLHVLNSTTSLAVIHTTGTGFPAYLSATGDNAELKVGSNGSTAAGTTFGITNNNLSFVLAANSPSALAIGSLVNVPIVFGVNNAEVGRFDTTGFAVTGLFTSTKTGQFLAATHSTTGPAYQTISNSTGSIIVGVEDSTGSTFGATAYDSVFYTSTGTGVSTLVAGTSGAITRVTSTGLAVTGGLSATGLLSVGGSTPASAGAAGVAGTITWDSDYIYVCVATNTWKRVAIATWP